MTTVGVDGDRMEVRYTDNLEQIDWSSVSNLFQAVGWDKRDPQDIQKTCRASSYIRGAFVDEELVGFGRTVDDGQFYALVVDLAVLPGFQGRGIGSTILSELRDELKDFSFTTLTAAVGKEKFYEKQGWLRQSTAFIWPRSEEQRIGHTE